VSVATWIGATTTKRVSLDARVVDHLRVAGPVTGQTGALVRWRFRTTVGPVVSGSVGEVLVVAWPGGTLALPSRDVDFYVWGRDAMGSLVDRPLPSCFTDVLAAARVGLSSLYYDEYVLVPNERVRVQARIEESTPAGGPYRGTSAVLTTHRLLPHTRATLRAGASLAAD